MEGQSYTVMNEEDVAAMLRRGLTQASNRSQQGALLFSGGLDSSIVASCNRSLTGINVSLQTYSQDNCFANSTAQHLGLAWHMVTCSIQEAVEKIPEVIRVLHSFDPALPNDLAVYIGMCAVKEKGFKTVYTGDGADELFAGYSYMHDMEHLGKYIKMISKNMVFSSNKIAEHLGLNLIQPFLEQEIVKCAVRIPGRLKVRDEKGSIYGKWILRKAFESNLPSQVVWQGKRPLEVGSGMTKLREILFKKISDEEFARNTYNIHFFNKEHMYYYKLFYEIFGPVQRTQDRENQCPGCGSYLPREKAHCYTCGWVRPLEEIFDCG